MDSSYQSFSAPCFSKQQQQAYFQIPQHCWLLQQPHDSGYGAGDEDLFAQAFKSNESDMKMMNEWVARLSTPALSNPPSSASSPFEYADSLVLPSENWLPYENDLTSYCTEYNAYGLPGNHAEIMATNTSTPAVAQVFGNHASNDSEASQAISLKPSSMIESCSVQESETYRPRQREHHTAVEQRYRKNLNQQFVSLRSAVPNIQTSQPQRAGQPAKPSKCEVLAGAVDYIKQLEEENRKLRGVSEDGPDSSRKRARTMA